MTPETNDGTDTEWEWRVYPKGGRGRNGYQTASRPSVVITPAGSISFNKATRTALGDDADDVTHIKYLVSDDKRLVGFEPTDEDDPNGYVLGDSSTTSFRAVLSSFGLDVPDNSVMVELQSDDDAPAPYIDIDEVERGYDGESDSGTNVTYHTGGEEPQE